MWMHLPINIMKSQVSYSTQTQMLFLAHWIAGYIYISMTYFTRSGAKYDVVKFFPELARCFCSWGVTSKIAADILY